MKKKPGARECAHEILYSVFFKNAYSNLELGAVMNKYDPDPRDRALASQIVYGVIQNYRLLDAYISGFCDKPVKKLQNHILLILREAFYQLVFLDKLPASAVVNEAVSLVKRTGGARSSGFVNAVLRAYLRSEEFSPKLPEDEIGRLSVEYSLDEALCRHFIRAYGKSNGIKIITEINRKPAVYIRRNGCRFSEEAFERALEEAEIKAYRSDIIDGAYRIDAKGNLIETDLFRKGAFFFEDITSQISAASVGARPGSLIIDMCAAPGSKSFAMAQNMDGKGKILSYDLHESRAELIKKAAERLGIENITCGQADALVINEELIGTADGVLADVPCSGFGIISKKPDIRLRSIKDMEELPQIQKKILENASLYVKKGGTLVYSTCTLNPAENEDVVRDFLKKHDEFMQVPVFGIENISPDEYIKSGESVTFLPGDSLGDGFFVSVMKRK